MTALTTDIATFVATVSSGSMPARANFGARIGMLDCVGTMIAGADEEAVKLVAKIVPTSTTNDGAPEIPNGRNLSASDAALVNGVAAHVLDYDDVGIDGHPSAALTPAILAEGWALGSSGEEAIAAYVAGYEVWALLQELEPGALHERGFHPTAIWGTLSAAAACARLDDKGVEVCLADVMGLGPPPPDAGREDLECAFARRADAHASAHGRRCDPLLHHDSSEERSTSSA